MKRWEGVRRFQQTHSIAPPLIGKAKKKAKSRRRARKALLERAERDEARQIAHAEELRAEYEAKVAGRTPTPKKITPAKRVKPGPGFYKRLKAETESAKRKKKKRRAYPMSDFSN